MSDPATEVEIMLTWVPDDRRESAQQALAALVRERDTLRADAYLIARATRELLEVLV